MPPRSSRRRRPAWIALGGLGLSAAAGLAAALLALLIGSLGSGEQCSSTLGSGQVVLGAPGTASASAQPNTAGPGDPEQRNRRRLRRQPARAPRQLRRARRLQLPDRHRDGRAALHDAAASHLGWSLGDRLQAGLRARRRPRRRAAEGDRPLVAARRGPRDPLRGRPVVRAGQRHPAPRHGLGQPARAERGGGGAPQARAGRVARSRRCVDRARPRACH